MTEQFANCPVGTDLVFGIGAVRGLGADDAAISGDATLPSPETDCSLDVHPTIAVACLSERLAPEPALTVRQLSQLLWAVYACTPHRASNGRGRLNVPSWRAEYFLTNRIYVIDDRVRRDAMRTGADQTTRDHRLKAVRDADVRGSLAASLPGLADAPCHIVLCLPRASAEEWYGMLEAGFAAGAILLQATVLGLGSHFRAALTPDESAALQQLAHIRPPTSPTP